MVRKMEILHFFQSPSFFTHTIDLEICANKPAHQNTPIGSPTVPYMGAGNNLQLWKWQYPAPEVVRKMEILHFSQFSSTFLHTIDLETCANEPLHQNTLLGSPTAPYIWVLGTVYSSGNGHIQP